MQEETWLIKLLRSIGFDYSKPTTMYKDNQGTVKLAGDSKFHSRTKHIDIKYHYILLYRGYDRRYPNQSFSENDISKAKNITRNGWPTERLTMTMTFVK